MNQRVSVGTGVTNEQIANIGKMIVNKIAIQRRVSENEDAHRYNRANDVCYG